MLHGNLLKKTFRDASTEISTQFNSMKISTQSTPIKAKKVSELLKDEKYSTPLSETPKKGPFDTSDKQIIHLHQQENRVQKLVVEKYLKN